MFVCRVVNIKLMKNLELNKFDVQEMNNQEMKVINGGQKAAYVWHDGAGPIQYFADALFNGGVTVYNWFN